MKIHKTHFRDGRYVYLCNQAVTPKGKKMSSNWKEVTCKNCLKNNILRER